MISPEELTETSALESVQVTSSLADIVPKAVSPSSIFATTLGVSVGAVLSTVIVAVAGVVVKL